MVQNIIVLVLIIAAVVNVIFHGVKLVTRKTGTNSSCGSCGHCDLKKTLIRHGTN